MALILKSNGFPAGTTELAPETVADVQIIPKEGPGELPANTLVRVVGCLSKSGSDWVLTSATAPERIERAGVGPGRREPSPRQSHDDAQVRPDAARFVRRAAAVGERHPDWRGRRGRDQRHNCEPRGGDMSVAAVLNPHPLYWHESPMKTGIDRSRPIRSRVTVISLATVLSEAV